jgi:hypothetical protein
MMRKQLSNMKRLAEREHAVGHFTSGQAAEPADGRPE